MLFFVKNYLGHNIETPSIFLKFESESKIFTINKLHISNQIRIPR